MSLQEELPAGFISSMQSLLGDEADQLIKALDMPPVVSVRLNSRKPGATFEDARPVRWCPTGFYLPTRPVFTLNPLLHAGAFYVQDASSMIYREATSRILDTLRKEAGLNTPPPLEIIDMCAAPGGKTTAMIDALPDGSRITANEFEPKRVGALRENIVKWGYPHVNITNRDTARFAENGDTFDLVAVDAPCSGEGMMRKEPVARTQWSDQLVENCASLQKEILTNAVKCVKPGGFLIYSTCTFNRKENEENAEFIVNTLGLEPFDPMFPEEWGIPGGIATTLPVKRFMPHKTEGEGLFLAMFRKPGKWEPSRPVMPRKVSVKAKTGKGNAKGKAEECPPIEDVLSTDFDRTSWPHAELSGKDALAYLRREAVTLPPETPKGLVVMCYKGLPLGMAKNIGTRANNLYPKGWRVLKQ